MLKLWTIKTIGWFADSHYMYTGNSRSTDAGGAQAFTKLTAKSSVLDLDNVAPGESITIEKGTNPGVAGFCLGFPNAIVLKKLIVISQGDQVDMIKIRYARDTWVGAASIGIQGSSWVY